MGFFEVPLTQMIDEKLRYHSQRMPVLAQNIANADTPGYQAKDVQAPDFKKMVQANQRLVMAQTSPLHLSTSTTLSPALALTLQESTYETNPNGNNVSIEEQMQKVSMNATDYQLALGLHESVDKMFKIAIGMPNKGG
jgi:flagellar basal-body rod protein FlgB